MKTRIVGVSGVALGLAVTGIMLLTGRMQGRQSNATADQTTPTPAAGDAAPNTPAPAETNALPPAPTTVSAAPSPTIAPTGVKLSKGAADVAKFAQAGIGEDVMLAYIGNVTSKFNLGSDQIVYLNDLGVSGTVVKAMIERDATIDATSRAAAASLAATAQPPPAPPVVDTNPPPVPPDDGSYPPPPMDNSTAQLPPPDSTTTVIPDDSDYFYNSLAPYGNWIYVAGCGVCWQPTVWVGNHGWRPYCDRGRWVYTDCGWYWQSDYSWGWAAFHYGRWFEDEHHGWVWRPDRVWGPAWVSWRQSGDYCGWAALPPSARYVPGTGFVYANHPVGIGFEFGLRAHQYTYIPVARLSDYAPVRYAAPEWQVAEIHNQTHVITQASEQNHHVVFRGIDPNQVAALARTAIRQAEVREVPHSAQQPFEPDRLGHSGGNLVIFRPQLPQPTRRPAANPGAPASHGSGWPRSSATPATPDVMRPTTTANAAPPVVARQPQPTEAALAKQRNDELIARLVALNKAANEQRPVERLAETETYPPGSLVLRGNGSPNLASTSSQPNEAWPQAASGTMPSRPSSGEYSAVNGSARPNHPAQHATVQSPSVYVLPGHNTVAQHLSPASTPYWMASTPASSTRSETTTIPGRFTATERLSEMSAQASHSYEAGNYSAASHPHSEQHIEAASHTSSESHESHSAPAPAAHESYSSHSSPSSSTTSSNKR